VDFIGKRYIWFFITGVAIIISLGFLIFSGLNFGVDFTGGTLLQLAFEEDVTVQDVKDVLRSEELDEFQLGGSFIQKTGGKMLIRTRELDEVEKARVFEAIRSRLGEFEDLGSQTVGPVVGRELATSAVKALIVASVLIVGYISVRFEFKSGVTAVLALLHDVILVAGIFSIFKIEVNSPFIAAVLTIIGYSINNTIVVFDRIRENQQYNKNASIPDIVNKSINDTLTRSLNTSITTALAVGTLFFFGAPVIKGFSLAMLLGIIVGTYSSIFIAGPLWVEWKQWEKSKT
jgi:preprotein translocase subunit SecF